MVSAERPRLRSHLRKACRSGDPHHVYLEDLLGLAPAYQRLTPEELSWLEFFDGTHTLHEIRAKLQSRDAGERPPLERLAGFVTRLDEGLFLDTPRFRQLADGAVRPARHVGSYEGDPQALRDQLRALFTQPHGPGLPNEPRPDGRLRAVLVPHMDYRRGGLTYAWGFKEIFEQNNARLFVIIGTSHHSAHRFTLTRKHFETPLGIVPTDQAYIDRLVAAYGDGLFDDEWLAHFPEHSIELEVVLLQYLYEHRPEIRIVPLVVGSFHDCVTSRQSPTTQADIARMIDALQVVEATTNEPICYLISGDLAHIGPKFNRGEVLSERLLRHSHAQDQALLRHTEAVDPLAYFRLIAAEEDARNICGFSPTFSTLEALRPSAGKVLHYDRYLHPHGHESVSFASVAFYR